MLAVGFVGEGVTSAYLWRRDPELLRRRLIARTEEKTPFQKTMQWAAGLTFTITLVISALDHRYGWSHVPPAANVFGDLLFAGGLAIIWSAFRANTYAAAVVIVEQAQTVVSAGPYAVVRHPMYTGLLVMTAGAAPALGSWLGLVGAVVFASVLVVRQIGRASCRERV